MLPTSVHPPGTGADRLLSVSTRSSRAGRVAVEAVGELDTYTTPLLEICLHGRAAEPGLRELVVDLSRVTFLGASAMAVLAEVSGRCRQRRARLVVLSGGRGAVRRPLELAGLVDVVGLDADLARSSRRVSPPATPAGRAAPGRRRRPARRPRTRSSRRRPAA